MKRLIYCALFFMFVFLLSGCVEVNYISYTDTEYPPKPKDYDIAFYDTNPFLQRPHKIIGRLEVEANTSDFTGWKDVYNKAKDMVRKKGADAVVNIKVSEQEYSGVEYVPGYTTYEPVTIYHVRDSRRSGYSIAEIPVFVPPQYIPYRYSILRYTGELLVFTED